MGRFTPILSTPLRPSLKNFVPQLAPIIRDIYKQSLREGYIPSLLKSSIVSPLPKVIPPRAIESDLRPISLTCTFVKVMEGFTCMQSLGLGLGLGLGLEELLDLIRSYLCDRLN